MRGFVLCVMIAISMIAFCSIAAGQSYVVNSAPAVQVPNLPLYLQIPTPQPPAQVMSPSPQWVSAPPQDSGQLGRPMAGRQPDVYVYHAVETVQSPARGTEWYRNNVNCYQRDVYDPQPVQYYVPQQPTQYYCVPQQQYRPVYYYQPSYSTPWYCR